MATFLIGCSIVFSSYKKPVFVNEVKVVSSWENLGDTALVKIPLIKNKISLTRGQQTRNLETIVDQFTVGDRVTIKMSYKGLHDFYEYEEFSGFIKSVAPKTPLEIECEDAVWLLRRVNLAKAWRQTTLKEVVSYIVAEVNKASQYKIAQSGKIPDVKFEKFRLDHVNGAEALQKIKEEYGLVAYFRGFELFVGLPFLDVLDSVKYDLAQNVIESDLIYRRAEDIRIKLKAVAILKDNKQIEVEVGDKEGDMRTQFYYNITDKATLKKIAEKDIEKLKFEGYEGGLQTFLVPFARHSMTARIVDPEFKKRDGNYLINEVETTYGRGIKRSIRIGKKL